MAMKRLPRWQEPPLAGLLATWIMPGWRGFAGTEGA